MGFGMTLASPSTNKDPTFLILIPGSAQLFQLSVSMTTQILFRVTYIELSINIGVIGGLSCNKKLT